MTSLDNNMGKFFEWLTKPMSDDDITSWYLANNIIPELTELFRDFCLSFLLIMRETYLGDDEEEQTETKIGMTEFQNREHFRWCWNKTIENFKKERDKHRSKRGIIGKTVVPASIFNSNYE